jgi:predicted transcriptional regulator
VGGGGGGIINSYLFFIFTKYKYFVMSTFTSSLPDDLLQQLERMSKLLKLPKNRLIETALRIYLDQLNKAEYIKSYKQLADDLDTLQLAEEGMADYLSNLEETEDEG